MSTPTLHVVPAPAKRVRKPRVAPVAPVPPTPAPAALVEAYLASAPLVAPAPLPAPRVWPRAVGGAVAGLWIPCAVFALVHYGMDRASPDWATDPLWIPVLAGLAFSAKTVYQWMCRVFRRADGAADGWKAFGWTVLTEVVMTFSPAKLMPLSVAGLVLLAVINAVESGHVAARGSKGPGVA